MVAIMGLLFALILIMFAAGLALICVIIKNHSDNNIIKDTNNNHTINHNDVVNDDSFNIDELLDDELLDDELLDDELSIGPFENDSFDDINTNEFEDLYSYSEKREILIKWQDYFKFRKLNATKVIADALLIETSKVHLSNKNIYAEDLYTAETNNDSIKIDELVNTNIEYEVIHNKSIYMMEINHFDHIVKFVKKQTHYS